MEHTIQNDKCVHIEGAHRISKEYVIYVKLTYIHIYTHLRTYIHTCIHTLSHTYVHTFIHTGEGKNPPLPPPHTHTWRAAEWADFNLSVFAAFSFSILYFFSLFSLGTLPPPPAPCNAGHRSLIHTYDYHYQVLDVTNID